VTDPWELLALRVQDLPRVSSRAKLPPRPPSTQVFLALVTLDRQPQNNGSRGWQTLLWGTMHSGCNGSVAVPAGWPASACTR